MDDSIWFVAVSIMFVLLGFVFLELDLAVWKKQKMDEIITWYHCDKVSEANKPAYCTMAGIGICAIGVGFIISGICAAFTQSSLIFISMAVGLVAGIVLLFLAQSRYNH